VPRNPESQLEKLLQLADKAMNHDKQVPAFQKALRNILRRQDKTLLERFLDYLEAQEELYPYLLSFTFLQLMLVSNSRHIRFHQRSPLLPIDAVAVVGLIPFSLRLAPGCDLAQLRQRFLRDVLQAERLREKAKAVGLTAGKDAMFFIPLWLPAQSWPTAWIEQYALTEDLLAHLFLEGEGTVIPDEEFASEPPVESSRIVSFVVPVALLTPKSDPGPLLTMLEQGPEQDPDILNRWEQVSAVLEQGLLAIPGVDAVECGPLQLQTEALGALTDRKNKTQLQATLERIRTEYPNVPLEVFAKGLILDSGHTEEWRILFWTPKGGKGIRWECIDEWENTENVLIDLLLEGGVEPTAIHIDPEVGDDREILDCPECGAPFFFRKSEKVATCSHGLPSSGFWN